MGYTPIVTTVILANLLISLVCLWLIPQVWGLRRALAATARAVNSWERSTRSGLRAAPEAILQGQRGIAQLHEQYSQLRPNVRRAFQIIGVARSLLAIWSRIFRRSIRVKSGKSSTKFPKSANL